MNDIKFPQPPAYPIQMSGKPQGYTTNMVPQQMQMQMMPNTNNPQPAIIIAPTPTNNTQQQNNSFSLGANFSGLIGSQVTVSSNMNNGIVAADHTPTRRKKKKSDDEVVVIKKSEDAKDSDKENQNDPNNVENVIYADTYYDTNTMAYNIIYQADELLRDCKQELDYIRSWKGNAKGKYHYINAAMGSMSALLSTKLAAIREINTTIKNVNDNEYRRFKDMRAINQADDNKAIMDAYSAFISAPVGAPTYNLPGTTAITGGLNGIVRADYPPEVQANVDAGMANYLANLTPEENLMLNDSNKDIEEVIVYDQSTGARRFQWMNTRTGEFINNMPPSSDLTLNDYTIDLRTNLAKNNNLNSIKKVVIRNGSSFNNF